MGKVKMMADISDPLPARKNRHDRKSGGSSSDVIKEEIHQVLDAPTPRTRYRLSDVSAGDPTGADPLESYSWQELRAMIYGHPRKR